MKSCFIWKALPYAPVYLIEINIETFVCLLRVYKERNTVIKLCRHNISNTKVCVLMFGTIYWKFVCMEATAPYNIAKKEHYS